MSIIIGMIQVINFLEIMQLYIYIIRQSNNTAFLPTKIIFRLLVILLVIKGKQFSYFG